MIKEIRSIMQNNGLDAIIINDNDPYMSEYIQDYYKFRNAVCGFTGSNGQVVIRLDEASMFTDGRYYIQAAKELYPEYQLKKAAEPTTIKYDDYASCGKDDAVVGFNYELFSINTAKSLQSKFNIKDIDTYHLFKNRPKLRETEVFLLKKYVENFDVKTAKLRKNMKEDKTDAYFSAKLDSVSYLYNLRSNDIDCNPSITGYTYVDYEKCYLFSNDIFNDEIKKYLDDNNVILCNLEDVYSFLKNIVGKTTISLDYNFVNYKLYNTMLNNNDLKVINHDDYLFMMKSLKSSAEYEGYKLANLNDGIALAEFYSDVFENQNQLSEYDLHEMLIRHRKAASKEYLEESFNPICAVDSNAAMMHYSAKADKSTPLLDAKYLLVDTGGHYLSGTTDITRTFALKKTASEKMIHCNTLALKGAMALMNAKFLYGVGANHLDVLCRQYLWAEGLDYKCGTGHGVGHILNVHEGPRNFRIDNQNVKMLPGAFITVEPGVYIENEFGLRIENNVICQDYLTVGLDHFYHFENLTLVPIDINLIDKTMLRQDEIKWINDYHKHVYKMLKDYVSERALNWLKEYTKEL